MPPINYGRYKRSIIWLIILSSFSGTYVNDYFRDIYYEISLALSYKARLNKLRLYKFILLSCVTLVVYNSYLKTINFKRLLVRQLNLHRLSQSFSIIGISLLTFGAISTFNEWQANAYSVKYASKVITKANATLSIKPQPIINGGAPSTNPISKSLIDNYTVSSDLPRYLIIPKLGVKSRVLSVGTDSTGAVQTPNNVFDTAWYDQSAIPGQSGASLIDGHISSWTSKGVFYDLSSLLSGDIIQVEKGDGTLLSFKVISSKTYQADNVDMNAALNPIIASTNALNLISCSGSVVKGTSEFNQRLIIFTEQI